MSRPPLTLAQTALEALDDARRGLARWQAWHVQRFKAPFPHEDEQPADWSAWIAAATEWGVAEADHLFPDVHPDERAMLIRKLDERSVRVGDRDTYLEYCLRDRRRAMRDP